MKATSESRKAERKSAALTRRLQREIYLTETRAQELFDEIQSTHAEDTTPIDRLLQTLRLHALESYSAALRMTAAWESARTHDRNGVRLARSDEGLRRLLYGFIQEDEHGHDSGTTKKGKQK